MKKKRRLKKWVKNLLGLLVFYSIGIGMFLIFAARAEQIDKMQKKELSNTPVQNVLDNSVNKLYK